MAEEWDMGIDEAGRGPVIGPLVYACCVWPSNMHEEFKSLGFADSKKLKENQRDQLFEVIKQAPSIKWETRVITSETISTKMLGRIKTSLNVISEDAACSLITSFATAQKYRIKNVYVDTLGKPETYRQKLKERFPQLNFIVESKADDTYPIVSAASICAKVTRDSYIKEYKLKYGEIGCGYPSDSKTRSFLSTILDPVLGFDAKMVRISWKTCEEFTTPLPKFKFEHQFEEEEQKRQEEQQNGYNRNYTSTRLVTNSSISELSAYKFTASSSKVSSSSAPKIDRCFFLNSMLKVSSGRVL
jgi:ribonuclease H2 subunit A